MRDKKKTKKYVAIFVLKEQGTFTRLAKKKFKPTDTSIRFRKRTFILDTSLATFSAGLKQFFFIDFVNGQTYLEQDNQDIAETKLTKKQKEEKAKLLKLQNLKVDPEITDMLISRKIISQLTANLTGNAMGINIMTLIIGIVIGACIGYIVAGM